LAATTEGPLKAPNCESDTALGKKKGQLGNPGNEVVKVRKRNSYGLPVKYP